MMRSADSLIIFVARIALAVLFLWGGAMKLMGYAGFIGYLQTRGVPYPHVGAPIAIAIELLGALALIFGIRTRGVGFAMAVYAVVTAVLGHDFWNVTDTVLQQDAAILFWKNLAIAGGFLLLIVTGAGRLSIDAMRSPRSSLRG